MATLTPQPAPPPAFEAPAPAAPPPPPLLAAQASLGDAAELARKLKAEHQDALARQAGQAEVALASESAGASAARAKAEDLQREVDARVRELGRLKEQVGRHRASRERRPLDRAAPRLPQRVPPDPAARSSLLQVVFGREMEAKLHALKSEYQTHVSEGLHLHWWSALAAAAVLLVIAVALTMTVGKQCVESNQPPKGYQFVPKDG